MNDKFFDLKKEKQDRIINAALKIFAQKGYEHASTDDIVKDANISKGLLFHYFISKLGLYSFIYDYSVKYMMLELSTGVSKSENDYFELIWQMWQSRLQVMYNYPYMPQFLNESRKEDVSDALMATEDKREILAYHRNRIMSRADLDRFRKDINIEKLDKMLEITLNGLLTEQFYNDSIRMDLLGEEIKSYLAMVKKMSYIEE